jgi:hypothetical protein
MIPNDLAEQVRGEVKLFKEAQDRFLETYRRLCVHYGGPKWQTEELATVFHDVRRAVIPVMEQAGIAHQELQALCSWAEKHVASR